MSFSSRTAGFQPAAILCKQIDQAKKMAAGWKPAVQGDGGSR